MNLKIRDNLLKYGMHFLNRIGKIKVTPLRDIDVSKSSGIIVVITTALGDAILCTPLFKSLKKTFPSKKIGAFLHRNTYPLFCKDNNLDIVIPYMGKFKDFFKTINEIRKHNFDIAMVANANDPDVIPMLYLAGIKAIIRKPQRSTIYTYLVSNQDMMAPMHITGHVIDRNLEMAKILGVKIEDKNIYVPLNDSLRKWAAGYLYNKGLKKPGTIIICFHPGASSKEKIWPWCNYVILGRNLLSAIPDIKIVLTGGRKELSLCRKIERGIGKNVINAGGGLSICQTAALINESDLFISGDTGPSHIASALGVKSLILFRASYTFPLFCPVDKPLTRTIAGTSLEEISVDQVFSSAVELINKEQSVDKIV